MQTTAQKGHAHGRVGLWVATVLVGAIAGILAVLMATADAETRESVDSPSMTQSATAASRVTEGPSPTVPERTVPDTPVFDAHCAGYRYGYALAYEHFGADRDHRPEIPSPGQAGCPRQAMIQSSTPPDAWCVGAVSGVAMFWGNSDGPLLIREIAAAVENRCIPGQWWQRDAAMAYAGQGLSPQTSAPQAG